MPAETCQNAETPICNELHNPLSISKDAQIVDPQRGTQNLVSSGRVGSSPTTGTTSEMRWMALVSCHQLETEFLHSSFDQRIVLEIV